MVRVVKEGCILGIGTLLVLNSIYLPYLDNIFGSGYISSPILTLAGTVYVGIGIFLVGLRFGRSDMTFRRSFLASSTGLIVFLTYVGTTRYGSFSLSAYLIKVVSWFPQVLLLALLFPLGFTTRRRQRLAIGVGMALAIFVMFIDSFLLSNGFNGPVFAVVYTGIYMIGTFVLGYPFYYVGQRYRHQQGGKNPEPVPSSN